MNLNARQGSGRLAAVTCAAGLLLSGCAFSIDESNVFAPRPFDAEKAAASGEPINGQKILEGTSATWTWDFGPNNDRVTLKGDPATFAPATVEHGKLEVKGGAIAWTMMTRAGADRPLIVRCGGNAATRQKDGFVYAATALPFGDVLLFDYPGSGETGGSASAESFESMLSGLVPFIEAKADGRDLVAWGHSLGGFVCSQLTARVPEVDGVVLETTARNPKEVADSWKPWYLGPLVRIRIKDSLAAYDNALALKSFPGPILVLGAEKDRTLEVELARSLNQALVAGGRKVTYVEIPGGGHSTLPGSPEFMPALEVFFDAVATAP